MHQAPGAVEPDHFAEAVAESHANRPGRDNPARARETSMLPAATSWSSGFHRCVRAFSTSVMSARPRRPSAVAEPRRELEPAGAAADDDDAVKVAA